MEVVLRKGVRREESNVFYHGLDTMSGSGFIISNLRT